MSKPHDASVRRRIAYWRFRHRFVNGATSAFTQPEAPRALERTVIHAHVHAVIRHHPWWLRPAQNWYWWAPWRMELLCRRCVMTYPCPSVRHAHEVLEGGQ